jgi:GNAT superfamily N-acetyltransferase
MGTMKQISPAKRNNLAGLFTNHKRVRMLVEAVLEGQFGTALADAEREPQVAQLSIGPFKAFGGDSQHPLAREMLQNLPPSFVLLDSDAWRELLFQIHGGQVKTQSRTAFSSAALDVEHLRPLARSVPTGFQVQRINLDIARRMVNELEMRFDLHAFSSPEDFAECGIGFAALGDQGQRIVCVATSYVICTRGIEIQIVTHAGFRRKGLGTATAAALIIYCLEHNLEPEWDAEHSVSAGLAEKLGYVQPEPWDGFIVIPA